MGREGGVGKERDACGRELGPPRSTQGPEKGDGGGKNRLLASACRRPFPLPIIFVILLTLFSPFFLSYPSFSRYPPYLCRHPSFRGHLPCIPVNLNHPILVFDPILLFLVNLLILAILLIFVDLQYSCHPTLWMSPITHLAHSIVISQEHVLRVSTNISCPI